MDGEDDEGGAANNEGDDNEQGDGDDDMDQENPWARAGPEDAAEADAVEAERAMVPQVVPSDSEGVTWW